MAIDIAVIKVQLEAVEDFTINDDTGTYDAVNNPGGYGTPNELRSDRANYLLVSKNAVNGDRTYLTVTNTTPLSTLIWSLNSSADGWHQATLLSFKKWNSGTTYVANDVQYYTSTGLFYYCILGHSNIAPDAVNGSTYWTVITDFTLIQQGYTNVEVIDYEFLIDSRSAVIITDEFYKILQADFACNLSLTEANDPLNLIAMLEAAYSKMLDDKGSQAEQIILAIADCTD